jgi:DNA-binding MarR family transcriptional regulator
MEKDRRGNSQVAFLLAQVGAHAATKFAERLAVLQLIPPDAGILRMLGKASGISQQELSDRLGIHPSRLVAILDGLESRKLLQRKPNAEDRRQYELHLSEKGRETLAEIGRIALEHQESLCASLTGAEREKLGELLQRIADEQGLRPGIHPGYRRLRP